METIKYDEIKDVDLQKTMEDSYIQYSMSVIASRALPDIRDGLKPVQRRILYAMYELSNTADKPHKKCARIVGETMGKYHPHGDTSIYGTLVNLAQEWSTRYPLIDGHGNFGSEDGDSPAAMRYTEARLSKISMEMMSDINKDTVDFNPNFDDSEKEPSVMPAGFPNLLVNGTTGIAVGMATNIPPHNLVEVISAVTRMIDDYIDDKVTTIDDLIAIVKGPDFPTGAEIIGNRGIEQAYRTGRGKIRVRAKTEVETKSNGKSNIIVTELPYMVNKARLVEKIAYLIRERKIDGAVSVSDESDREGIRINIDLKKDANANVTLNQLYKHTQMQDSFGVIMLSLVNGEPKVLNLLDMLKYYIKHREEVVERRTRFDLKKAEDRAHILEGLKIAIDHIDEIIKLIRESYDDAKEKLMQRFELSMIQAQAILDMQLKRLQGLEKEKIDNEYRELMSRIAYFKELLADRKKLLGVIKEELQKLSDKYGDIRRTSIGFDYGDISTEDLIPKENIVITRTSMGYIKRMSIDNFKSQNRGGKGIKGMSTIENDYIEDLLLTTTHHYIMFFTNSGRVYRLKGYEIPEAGRTARGTAIVNLIQLHSDEKITAVIAIKNYEEGKSLFMATKYGIVKKTSITEYERVRKVGLSAINLRDDDELIEVKISDSNKHIFLVTKYGQCIRFKETDVRPTGRVSMGVIGMNLEHGDEVIGMQMDSQGKYLLFVSELGLGKRTRITEFSPQNRGGKGNKCYKITEKTGNVVGFKAVNEEHELMIITTEGTIIRMACESISVVGRVTSGVKLINLGDHHKVASIAKVRESISSADTDSSVMEEKEE